MCIGHCTERIQVEVMQKGESQTRFRSASQTPFGYPPPPRQYHPSSTASAHNGIHYTQQQSQNGVWGDNVLHACVCVCVYASLCVCIVVEIIFIILHNFYMESQPNAIHRGRKAKKMNFYSRA